MRFFILFTLYLVSAYAHDPLIPIKICPQDSEQFKTLSSDIILPRNAGQLDERYLVNIPEEETNGIPIVRAAPALQLFIGEVINPERTRQDAAYTNGSRVIYGESLYNHLTVMDGMFTRISEQLKLMVCMNGPSPKDALKSAMNSVRNELFAIVSDLNGRSKLVYGANMNMMFRRLVGLTAVVKYYALSVNKVDSQPVETSKLMLLYKEAIDFYVPKIIPERLTTVKLYDWVQSNELIDEARYDFASLDENYQPNNDGCVKQPECVNRQPLGQVQDCFWDNMNLHGVANKTQDCLKHYRALIIFNTWNRFYQTYKLISTMIQPNMELVPSNERILYLYFKEFIKHDYQPLNPRYRLYHVKVLIDGAERYSQKYRFYQETCYLYSSFYSPIVKKDSTVSVEVWQWNTSPDVYEPNFLRVSATVDDFCKNYTGKNITYVSENKQNELYADVYCSVIYESKL